MTSNLGLIGLGTMGKSLARNIASRGFSLSLWNRTTEKINEFVDEFPDENFYAPQSFEDFVESIERPRRIILMVPAGDPTADLIKKLAPILDKDDAIMDGGNAIYKVTEIYQKQLEEKGIHLLGVGISGGEEGALKGPSIMPGGPVEAWEEFEEVQTKIAAEDFNGKACVSHMGKGGAGHYVKMVHNGIEYAEMQMLAEAYQMLKELYKLSHNEIADIFEKWSEGRMASYLTDISVDVLRKKEDGKELLDLILDKAKNKGTGVWTTQEALRLGVPSPTIAGAVFMRGFSNSLEERKKLDGLYPRLEQSPEMTLSEFTEHLEKALFATRLANFEQGFAILRAADKEMHYGLNFSEITRIWQGGCIIRSAILKDMNLAFSQKVQNLYFTEFAHTALVECQKSWKLIVNTAVKHSIPMLSISGGLSHFEASRRGRSSANFIQGLRDRFGSHTYERIDQEGSFHSEW